MTSIIIFGIKVFDQCKFITNLVPSFSSAAGPNIEQTEYSQFRSGFEYRGSQTKELANPDVLSTRHHNWATNRAIYSSRHVTNDDFFGLPV
jgi:hypothetical protein